MRTIIGLDIGGTKTAIVEGTFAGEILSRVEMATEAERPFAETAPELARVVCSMCDEANREGREPVAISVAVAGPVRARDGVLANPPNLPGWHGANLGAAFGIDVGSDVTDRTAAP